MLVALPSTSLVSTYKYIPFHNISRSSAGLTGWVAFLPFGSSSLLIARLSTFRSTCRLACDRGRLQGSLNYRGEKHSIIAWMLLSCCAQLALSWGCLIRSCLLLKSTPLFLYRDQGSPCQTYIIDPSHAANTTV